MTVERAGDPWWQAWWRNAVQIVGSFVDWLSNFVPVPKWLAAVTNLLRLFALLWILLLFLALAFVTIFDGASRLVAEMGILAVIALSIVVLGKVAVINDGRALHDRETVVYRDAPYGVAGSPTKRDEAAREAGTQPVAGPPELPSLPVPSPQAALPAATESAGTA